jgi:enediyne core biosynthesis thioesterase
LSIAFAPTFRPAAAANSARAFVYRHLVSFEDTNVVGNVYFAKHVAWQGRCREHFLKVHAPEVLRELAADFRMVTLSVSCDYFEEIHALDEVEIRMMLAHLRAHRIGLNFEYVLAGEGRERIVARGFQEIGCMRQGASGLAPSSPPRSLADALMPFVSSAVR